MMQHSDERSHSAAAKTMSFSNKGLTLESTGKRMSTRAGKTAPLLLGVRGETLTVPRGMKATK